MSKVISNSIHENFIGFDAYKLESAEVIWADYSSLENKIGIIENLDKAIIDHSAYLIKDTSCFASLPFSLSDKKVLYAERYGGEGIGINGGGGRCGNTEHFQLKGIGANCTVGVHDDIVHKYGGLDAPMAIIEIIYANLFNRLLPLGAVKIHALIYTGQKTAIYHHPANSCWGVIMVRDRCVRPAHLMRAPLFAPHKDFKHQLTDDVVRVRSINKKLSEHFKGANQFISFLGNFLRNCANQFGFARAMRAMHGTISPSNITIEGQWLDLPIASMLSGGVNQCMSSHFYTEHQAPLKYTIEMLHGYGKYNRLSLNPAPLINYYNEQFSAYFRHYIGYVLGLDLGVVEKLDKECWHLTTEAFDAVIHNGKFLDDRPIKQNDNDPVHALICALFISLVSPSLALPHFRLASVEEQKAHLLSKAFLVVIKEAWEESKINIDVTFASFAKGAALTALKRAYLSAVYFSPKIADATWDLCQHKSTNDVAEFISSYDAIGDWIFITENEHIVLYRTEGQEISYSQKNELYTLRIVGEEFSTKNISDLLSIINKDNPQLYMLNGFSFIAYLNKLANIIACIESSEIG